MTIVKKLLGGVAVLLTLVIFGSLETKAQACQLMLKLRPENSGGILSNAKVALVSFKTRRTFWGITKDDKSYFQNIPAGAYVMIVRQPGFMTTLGELQVSCGRSLADRNTYVWIVQCKGDEIEVFNEGTRTTKIVEKNPNRFTVMGSVEFVCKESRNEDLVDLPPQPSPPSRRITMPISGGVLNGKALSLPKPPYPAAARAVHASGQVVVQVVISETGSVISASAVSGHPLLRAAAVAAARGARFAPTLLDGVPVKVSGVITYNFVP